MASEKCQQLKTTTNTESKSQWRTLPVSLDIFLAQEEVDNKLGQISVHQKFEENNLD